MGFPIALWQSNCCHRAVGSDGAVVIKTPCQKGRERGAGLSISSTLQAEQIQSTVLGGFGFALCQLSHHFQIPSFFFSSFYSICLHFFFSLATQSLSALRFVSLVHLNVYITKSQKSQTG